MSIFSKYGYYFPIATLHWRESRRALSIADSCVICPVCNRRKQHKSHFPKSHHTHHIYQPTPQSLAPEKSSMTAPPVSIMARIPCCHRNPVCSNQFSIRSLGYKRLKHTPCALSALLSVLCVKDSKSCTIEEPAVNKKQDYQQHYCAIILHKCARM